MSSFRRHRLGFAVKVLGDGGLPSHDTRRWQSGPHLSTSLTRLGAILDYLDRHDIRMYRMATALAPYASHPDLPRFHGQLDECQEELAAMGALVKRLDVRLSTHPGQYTVLNSERESVRDAAIAELDHQAALLDAMNLGPDAVIVLHVGGAAGGTGAGRDRFLRGFELLSEAAKRRLVIENDDRTFGLGAVLEVHASCGVPVVWDVLHHRCNDPDRIPDAEAADRAAKTWPAGVIPKVHFSSPRLTLGEKTVRDGRRVQRTPALPPLRAHADLVDPLALESFLLHILPDRDVDVMLEAKAKDLALLQARDQLRDPAVSVVKGVVQIALDRGPVPA